MSEIDDLINFILDITSVKSLGETEEEHSKNLVFIYNFIVSKYFFFTIEEIKEAFRMYVANKFDIKVYRILDCIVVGEVLTSYLEYRNEILKTYTPKETVKIEAITESGKDEINRNAVNRVFSEFISTNELPEGIGYIYDILVESCLIKVPGENTPKLKAYYEKKMEEAKKELLLETEKYILKAKAGMDKGLVHSLQNTLKNISESSDNSIVVRAKKLVLKDFFISKIMDKKEKIFD